MLMVIGCIVVLAGVVIGWYTVAGSGINRRPYGKGDAPGSDRMDGESPLDSSWQMGNGAGARNPHAGASVSATDR